MIFKVQPYDVTKWNYWWCLLPRFLFFEDGDMYFVFFEKVLRRKKIELTSYEAKYHGAITWEYKRATWID
jgi:hypothetical protein